MIEKLKLFLLNSLFLFFCFPFNSWGKEIIYNGEILFKNNCSVCHLGGNNIIIPEKNLKKQTLDENGMNTISTITYQIMNGKNGMPAFGGRLMEVEIDEIAKYVLEASEKNFQN
jgi:cytochrome c6